MKPSLKQLLLSFLAGVVGVVFCLVLVHLYYDHQLVDLIRNDIMKNQQRQQQVTPAPAPAASPTE